MVEGPGCTNNGKKVSSIVGYKVIQINTICNAQPEATKTYFTGMVQDGTHPTLQQVFTIGKELFLIFQKDEEEVALRLHFGMNGSLILEKRRDQHMYLQTDSIPKHEIKRNGSTATLDMMLVHSISMEQVVFVRTYQTTISNMIPAKAPRLKYDRMKNRDICSPDFDYRFILEDLSKQSYDYSLGESSSLSDAFISDVLLHQHIFPGIGNIIKVEGLHEARIHPKRTLKTLTKDELYNVVMSCRSYALLWLKSGKSPPKRVYNQTLCGSCAQESIVMAKVGQTDRTTFWCRNCQSMESKVLNEAEPMIRRIEPSSNDDVHNVDSTKSLSSLPTSYDFPLSNVPKIRKVCSIHGPDGIVLRRCRRGIHEQRIYYSCKVRNCNYFCWADGSFPSCKCGKRVVMRISKTDKSGGRWFFHCSQRKDVNEGKRHGCGYFQWVDEEFKKGFGALLTPLL